MHARNRGARRPIDIALVIVALTALVSLCGCDSGGRGAARDVLLVTIDTLRPDHVGAYGHPRARTPHLDAFARHGTLFTDARAPYPLTLPSHASLLTGRLPYRHGARRNDSFAFDPGLPTLQRMFASAGRATGAIVSTFVLNRGFGLAADFGTYLDLEDPSDPRRGRNERRARETTRLATEWLSARGDSTFFLWTHYFDPHDDYEPPPPWNKIFRGGEIDLYDGEIAYTDVHLGRLLRTLERRADHDDLLVIVTSDHGEAFGEHREIGHGFFLYDTTIRVPLMIARPGRNEPARIHRRPVRTVDVFPTVCGLTGLPMPAETAGIFLDPFGDGPDHSPPLYLETFEPTVGYGATDLRAVVADDWKWIEAPRPEIYSLRDDPHETVNRYPEEIEWEESLREILDEHREAERAAASAQRDPGGQVDEETRARLLALGYVTSGAEEEAATAWSRRDPKDIVHLIPRMYAGIRACNDRRMDEGLAILRDVLEEDPLNAKALHWISQGHLADGDSLGALEVYRTALEHDPRNVGILNQIGLLSLRIHRPADAIPAFKAAVEIDPRHVAGWLNLASAHMMAQHPRKAREAVVSALRIDPTNQAARSLAYRLGMRPRPEGAQSR